MSKLVDIGDYRRAARRALPRILYDYVEGGSQAETTLRRNHAGFDDWWLRSRVLRQNADVSIETEVLGTRIALPVMIAPTGGSSLLWPRGEEEVARAAHDKRTIMSVSCCSILTMEEIAAAAPGPKWLQIFLFSDRGLTTEFLDRAKAAGYTGITVTVDAFVGPIRWRDLRNGFSLTQKLTPKVLLDGAMHPSWVWRMKGQPRPTIRNFAKRTGNDLSDLVTFIGSFQSLSTGWDELQWLRSRWDGPLIVKGILHPDDAKEAVRCGADAIQVSNHGGRQLDGSLAAIDALPEIAEAIQGQVELYLDGGITRGTDVVKAIALGADACLIGRSHLWGLATAGRAGVGAVLDILAAEIKNALESGGWKSLAELNRDSVRQLGAG